MAERQPPSFLQAGSHPAEHDRLVLSSLLGGGGAGEGVVAAGDLAVTQNATPNMSANVAAGAAFVKNDLSPFGGTYHVQNDATVNKTIAAADATNPRRDLVVARIRDASYFGATNAWDLFVVTGTPAPSPVDPAIPADGSYLLLARVAVAAGAASITNANITDLRTFVFGGAWTSWTPTLANLTQGNGTVSAKHIRLGRLVHYRFQFTLGTTNSAVGTTPTFSLPVAPSTDYFTSPSWVGNCILTDASGPDVSAVATPSGSNAELFYWGLSGSNVVRTTITATAPFTWTTGDIIEVDGFYEAAA